MRKTKKYIFSILIIVLIISCFALYSHYTYRYITQANEQLQVDGVRLLASEKEMESVLQKGFLPAGGFGIRPYENKDAGVKIAFSGFPDVVDTYVLTDISITKPDYGIYGIHVGDEIVSADKILQKSGYIKKDADKNDVMRKYNKKRINILFTVNDANIITEIRILLQSTNKKNIIF